MTTSHFLKSFCIKLKVWVEINEKIPFTDAMAMVKLNVFHWHIADSQSFPMVLKSHPELSELGAYSADKVYTIADIQEVSVILKIKILVHQNN